MGWVPVGKRSRSTTWTLADAGRGVVPGREVIDVAASIALGVSEYEVADWRRRLAVEPTIMNARAPHRGGGSKT